MHRDDLGDALSFVNDSRQEPLSLRPGGQEPPSRLRTLLGASSILGVVFAILTYGGFIQIPALEKLIKGGPQPRQLAGGPAILPVPPVVAPPVSRRIDAAPRPVDKPAIVPVQAETKPQAPAEPARTRSLAEARGTADKPDDEPNLNARKPPKDVLEGQGLKLAGDRFILAAKEQAAAATFNRNLSKFDKLHNIYPRIYRINYMRGMIDYAETIRQGMAFDNGDLNNAMDSIPTRGGSREQYLNNIQRGMHNQLLANRQDMNDLGRMIAAWRAELRNLGPGDQLLNEFRALAGICQQSLSEIDNEMSSIGAEYDRLNGDGTVTDALAEFNRVSRTSNVIGPSADFLDAQRQLDQEKRFFGPSSQGQSRRRR